MAPHGRLTQTALVAVAALLLAAGLVAGVASGNRDARPESRVVTCDGHSFSFSFAFDPKRGVVVRSGTRVLVRASLRGSIVSSVCKAAADPHAFVFEMVEPSNNLYRRTTITCRVAGPLGIYLAPAYNGRSSTRNILVMAGDPPTTVVGAALTQTHPPTPLNIRRRRVPVLYRIPENCSS